MQSCKPQDYYLELKRRDAHGYCYNGDICWPTSRSGWKIKFIWDLLQLRIWPLNFIYEYSCWIQRFPSHHQLSSLSTVEHPCIMKRALTEEGTGTFTGHTLMGPFPVSWSCRKCMSWLANSEELFMIHNVCGVRADLEKTWVVISRVVWWPLCAIQSVLTYGNPCQGFCGIKYWELLSLSLLLMALSWEMLFPWEAQQGIALLASGSTDSTGSFDSTAILSYGCISTTLGVLPAVFPWNLWGNSPAWIIHGWLI